MAAPHSTSPAQGLTPRQGPTTGEAPAAEANGSNARRRSFLSHELFGGDQEIDIRHGNATYRLRLTSLGKLILTK